MPGNSLDNKLCINIPPSSEKESIKPAGLYSSSGTLILESPPTVEVNKLRSIDPRITYFHFYKTAIDFDSDGKPKISYSENNEQEVILPATDDELLGFDIINNDGGPVNIAYDCVISQLTKYIREKYGNEKIAIRGVACSISTSRPIVVEGNLITNPGQILSLGAERAVESSPMINVDQDGDSLPYRSIQWLYQHPQQLRAKAVEEGMVEKSHKIFPLLIVYDRLINPDNWNLPKDPMEREKAIKEVILLDYPLGRKEFKEKVKK
jgi:hypothetical protein